MAWIKMVVMDIKINEWWHDIFKVGTYIFTAVLYEWLQPREKLTITPQCQLD